MTSKSFDAIRLVDIIPGRLPDSDEKEIAWAYPLVGSSIKWARNSLVVNLEFDTKDNVIGRPSHHGRPPAVPEGGFKKSKSSSEFF